MCESAVRSVEASSLQHCPLFADAIRYLSRAMRPTVRDNRTLHIPATLRALYIPYAASAHKRMNTRNCISFLSRAVSLDLDLNSIEMYSHLLLLFSLHHNQFYYFWYKKIVFYLLF